MAEQETYITEEVRALIGKESEPITAFHAVESSEVRRFIQAIMDDDPIYWDAEYAKKTKYGTELYKIPGIGHENKYCSI